MVLRVLVLLVVFSFGFSLTPTEVSSLQAHRFLYGIERVDQIMTSSKNPEKVIEGLLRRARVPAFDVQGMARYYRKSFPFFKGLRRDFKRVEDFVGKIDQWENELRKANKKGDSTRASIAQGKLVEWRADMLRELSRREPLVDDDAYEADRYPWMAQKGEISKTQFYASQVFAEFAGITYEQDRKILIDRQLDNIKDIVDDYEADRFDNLELENGIHSFRKDLRWILIEMRVSHGFFTFDPDPKSCDIPAFASLPFSSLAKNKFLTLRSLKQEPRPCYIQQCVFLGLAQLQNKVAELKDEIENEDVVSEKDRYKEENVPQSYRDQMQKLYGDFLKHQPWQVLQRQLKTCQDQ